MRMTFDFHGNDLKMSAYLTARLAEIGRAMDPVEMTASPRKGPYNISIYQTTHNTDGTVMGDNPATSVVNRYCQSWEVHNVFVPGGKPFAGGLALQTPFGTIVSANITPDAKTGIGTLTAAEFA